MATQKFKPGDKVKFTQEAKDRFDNDEYWHSANYPELDLDGTYTVKGYSNDNWPSYSLEEEDTAPHIADYLLEPAEAEQTEKKNMTKKEFILALGKAIVPEETLEYKGTRPCSKLYFKDMDITVDVLSYKHKDGTTVLKMVPDAGGFEECDHQAASAFLNVMIPDDSTFEIYLDGDNLVIESDDYLWDMVQYSVESEEPEDICSNCEALRKANADKLRLQAELDQAKAEIAKLKGQANRKADRRREPWMKAFEFPGGKGIAFGFEF